MVLSAEPETKNSDVAEGRVGERVGLQIRCQLDDFFFFFSRNQAATGLTIDIDRPDRTVVAMIRSQTLSIVGEPDVDDVVL
jgi:hypothetical protein